MDISKFLKDIAKRQQKEKELERTGNMKDAKEPQPQSPPAK